MLMSTKMSCSCDCGGCCERVHSKRKLLASLYYAINGSGGVINEYASAPETGSQYSAYFPRTNSQGTRLTHDTASFFYNGSALINSPSLSTTVETVTYADGDNTFSATSQYSQETGSITTTVAQNTFAVTSGLGRYRNAKYVVIDYDNDAPALLRTVRVYA